ncbi:TrmB family transcriptional regulator [Alkalihalobacillus sp. CinArs1]|uniref:TrmB family transcriptional regulator n=1 Tax=Alkalihalobacillus sp. CinArs1 TaxID=2995314 RepID=UPI0022DCEA38|nr:TrmB family transcriptional regulator [Alkalihalobacillus sp. CinArs1]
MLQQFGFTQYESQIYEALITTEEALDASAIVKQSGVPRSKVYEVLYKMGEKGMVLESTVEKKRLYRPLPLNSAIEKLQRDFNRNIDQLKSYEARKKPLDDRVWSLKDNQSIDSLVADLLKQATSSIVYSGWSDDLSQHISTIEEKQMNGISVELHSIGELDTKIDTITTLIPDVQHEALQRSRILIVDNKELVFAGYEETGWQAIHTSSRPLVTFFTEFFYHDVALTEITRKFGALMMEDEDIKNVLLKLRY